MTRVEVRLSRVMLLSCSDTDCLITLPPRGMQSIVMSDCLSAHISQKPYGLTYQFFYAWPWLGTPLAHCDTLCTSGFLDDVTFFT